MCSVRNARWQLISHNGGAEPKWQLFDVKADPGQQTDAAAQHPDVVKQLAAAYDQWWSDCQPLLLNEKVVGPKLNPFAELYWKQFGGGPDEALLKRMDPQSSPSGEASQAPKKQKAGAAK
jgi:arylsulfatase